MYTLYRPLGVITARHIVKELPIQKVLSVEGSLALVFLRQVISVPMSQKNEYLGIGGFR